MDAHAIDEHLPKHSSSVCHLDSRRADFLEDLFGFGHIHGFDCVEQIKLYLDAAASIYIENRYPLTETFESDVHALKRSLIETLTAFHHSDE